MRHLNLSARWSQPLLIVGAIGMLLAPAACSEGTVPPEKLGTPVAKADVVPAAMSATGDHSGEPAKFDYTLKDMNGATVQLASFKGQPLVVNFWATWCPPCKLEIPWFIELKSKYAAQGLQIVGVSIDDPAEELRTFSAEHKMNYPVLLGIDQEKMLEAYDAEVSVPVTWFIRKDGTVHTRTIGINSREYFETQIKALF